MKAMQIWLPALTMGVISAVADEPIYEEPEITDKDREHWAFRPISHPPVPEIDGVDHPIDAFLLERLQREGIADFSPEADARTLLRRLTFDLTGLPPTPEQLESVSAESPNAQTVDSLLASTALRRALGTTLAGRRSICRNGWVRTRQGSQRFLEISRLGYRCLEHRSSLQSLRDTTNRR